MVDTDPHAYGTWWACADDRVHEAQWINFTPPAWIWRLSGMMETPPTNSGVGHSTGRAKLYRMRCMGPRVIT